MLILENIHTYYGKSHILHGVSLTVGEGEIVSLLGRNGVGKTTTLRTIMGLTPPTEGSILFREEEITRLKSYQIAKKGIGLIPEERWIFPTLTVDQNLLIGQKKGASEREEWTLEMCYATFPALERRRDTKAGSLSGGEKQMLTIARTLMGNPDLILVDEPTEGLAPKIVETVRHILQTISEIGITILLVEQKLTIALVLSDRIYVMSKGTIQWEGTPDLFAEDDEVLRRYLED